ncbi:MAG: helix-turn-helix domain-containing protein [archaeon]
MSKIVPNEIRTRIINLIRSGKITVAEAADQFQLHRSTVSAWLLHESPYLAEVNRLKRQNKELLEIIGELSVEVSRSKKNSVLEEISSESEDPTE